MYSDIQLSEVASLFGLCVERCHEMSGGSNWMGRRYAIDTSKGRFFLKVRSDWWPPAQAQYVCGLLQDLGAEGFPVPFLRQTLAGELFAQWQGHVCECHVFVDGQAHTLGSLGQVAAAGRELWRFHSLTTTWGRPGNLLPISCGYPNEERVHFFADRVRDLFADDAAALDVLDQLLDHLHAVPTSEGRALVHGDYHPAILVFREDQVVAVCDFDMVQEAPCAFDLGYFLYRAAGRPSRGGGGPARLDRAVAQAFLKGYHGANTDGSPLVSRHDVARELLRFAWFNVLLVAHNTRAPERVAEWSADTVALAEDLEGWSEKGLLV